MDKDKHDVAKKDDKSLIVVNSKSQEAEVGRTRVCRSTESDCNGANDIRDGLEGLVTKETSGVGQPSVSENQNSINEWHRYGCAAETSGVEQINDDRDVVDRIDLSKTHLFKILGREDHGDVSCTSVRRVADVHLECDAGSEKELTHTWSNKAIVEGDRYKVGLSLEERCRKAQGIGHFTPDGASDIAAIETQKKRASFRSTASLRMSSMPVGGRDATSLSPSGLEYVSYQAVRESSGKPVATDRPPPVRLSSRRCTAKGAMTEDYSHLAELFSAIPEPTDKPPPGGDTVACLMFGRPDHIQLGFCSGKSPPLMWCGPPSTCPCS